MVYNFYQYNQFPGANKIHGNVFLCVHVGAAVAAFSLIMSQELTENLGFLRGLISICF